MAERADELRATIDKALDHAALRAFTGSQLSREICDARGSLDELLAELEAARDAVRQIANVRLEGSYVSAAHAERKARTRMREIAVAYLAASVEASGDSPGE